MPLESLAMLWVFSSFLSYCATQIRNYLFNCNANSTFQPRFDGVKIFLHTPENAAEDDTVEVEHDASNIGDTTFDPSRKTFMLIHGWGSEVEKFWGPTVQGL